MTTEKKVIFATPGNGQTKPIESLWRTVSENMTRRFEGKGAIPEAEYETAFQEEVDAYNRNLTQ